MKTYLQDQKDIVSDDSSKVSRRKFFGKLGTAVVGVAALGAAAPFMDENSGA